MASNVNVSKSLSPGVAPQKYKEGPVVAEPTVKPSLLTDQDLIVAKTVRVVFHIGQLAQDQIESIALFVASNGGGFAAYSIGWLVTLIRDQSIKGLTRRIASPYISKEMRELSGHLLTWSRIAEVPTRTADEIDSLLKEAATPPAVEQRKAQAPRKSRSNRNQAVTTETLEGSEGQTA